MSWPISSYDPQRRASQLASQRLSLASLALIFLAGPARVARAQADTSTGPTTQIWANLTLGKAVSERAYLELDVEPKRQVTSGDQWRGLDVTPLVEYYPASWLDLQAEASVGKTHQRDGLDTFEITPRVGARFRLFAKMAPHRPGIPGLKHDRLPLTRLALSTLVRLELRNFYYSDDTPNRHEGRVRLRLETKLALNHDTLARDSTLYAIGDAEYYAPLGEDLPERYVNKMRVRLGLGYRFSVATKLELLYIRDWNRTSPDAKAAEDAQALDVRVKLLF